MAKRGRTRKAVQIGSHRGGAAFVEAAPVRAAEALGEWEFFDAKPGRAADLAQAVARRFPGLPTTAREKDGRDAPRQLADDAVIVSTVDTAQATRDVIESRRALQSLIFQLVGRGPGPALSATRLGISGVITDADVHEQARLLLDGFAAIAAEASSRVLTNGADPVTAATLQPMRRATTRKSARYFADVLHEAGISDPALTFFTGSGEFPLIVRPHTLNLYRAEKEQALDLVDTFAPRRSGLIASVAFVSIEKRAIDVLFVSQGRNDRRRVERVMSFRAAASRVESATFTD